MQSASRCGCAMQRSLGALKPPQHRPPAKSAAISQPPYKASQLGTHMLTRMHALCLDGPATLLLHATAQQAARGAAPAAGQAPGGCCQARCQGAYRPTPSRAVLAAHAARDRVGTSAMQTPADPVATTPTKEPTGAFRAPLYLMDNYHGRSNRIDNMTTAVAP